jgi:hypothetical protein
LPTEPEYAAREINVERLKGSASTITHSSHEAIKAQAEEFAEWCYRNVHVIWMDAFLIRYKRLTHR